MSGRHVGLNREVFIGNRFNLLQMHLSNQRRTFCNLTAGHVQMRRSGIEASTSHSRIAAIAESIWAFIRS